MKRFKISRHQDVSQSTSVAPTSPQAQTTSRTDSDHSIFKEAKARLTHLRAYESLMQLVKGAGRAPVLLAKLAEPCLEGSPFKAIPAVFTVIAEAVATVKDTKDDANALLERFYERVSTVAEHISRSGNPNSQDVAAEFIREIFDHADKINHIAHASYVKVLDSKELKGKLEEIVKDIDRTTGTFSVRCFSCLCDSPVLARAASMLHATKKKRLTNIQLRVLLAIERDTKSICDRLMNGNFDRWNRARSARFKADTAQLGFARGSCTEGTRVEVLNTIYRWAADTSTPPIFWLSGMAGSGKSTIAYSVCKHFSVKNTAGASLGASFFCSRQVADLRQLGNIIPTIAYQLARHSRLYAQALEKADPDVVDVSGEQVEELLLKPWAGFANKRPDELPLNLIVIDALDEIENEGGVQLLTDLIDVVHKLGHNRMRQLKIFVTSRPHPRIVNSGARLGPDTVFHLEDIKKEDGLRDVFTFLSHKLPELATSHPRLLQTLANRSEGLFIYAATVVRALFPPDSLTPISAKERYKILSRLLEDSSASDFSDLDAVYNLYKQVLLEAIPLNQRGTRLPIIHRIICALQPLSLDALARLTDDDDVDFDATTLLVKALHSVLYVSTSDGCVYVYHKSFSDFLLDSRLSSPELACRADTQNAVLSRACFRLMDTYLHFNMCSLSSSFLLDSEVPNLSHTIKTKILDVPGLDYVCRFWATHAINVAKSPEIVQQILRLLSDFIGEKVLYWIEVMNLLGARAYCDDRLQKVVLWVDAQAGASLELKRSLRAVVRLARSFLYTAASSSTPHLYVSCLATEFAMNSEVSSVWKAQFPSLPRIQCTVAHNQVPVFTHIKAGAAAYCVVLSPDGSRLVTGCSDESARIWDALTGTQLQELKGHTEWINSVAFSLDGLCVVSGSSDKSVRVWEASTGAQLRELSGHTDRVKSVAFSPDGSRVVSGSDDASVRVWDALTGAQLHKLNGHTHWVHSVAFSPEGARVVSASEDGSMCIWDAVTGAQLRMLNGQADWINSAVFSPDGLRIVSGSSDAIIRIWNASTGVQMQRLYGHEGSVSSVAFSPDGSRIVSGSHDESVRIWNASTGDQLKYLTGHKNWVFSVAFSLDGSRVVSGSYDKSVRIWDASMETQTRQRYSDTGTVGCVALSPDGLRIASSSCTQSVCIWDTLTGQKIQELDDFTGWIGSVAFSPDGLRLATGSSSGSARVWDALTGAQLKKLDGHEEWVFSVAFSPDGSRIASGSCDKSVMIWNALTGARLQKLDGHTGWVFSVSYSPEGVRVVSASVDGSVRIWDTSTGSQLHKLSAQTEWDIGPTEWFTSAVFSPDGLCIVSGSNDQTIYLWDASTGAQIRELNGHEGTVSSVAFSPDGSRIVSGSHDNSVRIWDALTGEQLEQLNGHTDYVCSVAFSPDGSHILSGSEDESVRIWNALAGDEADDDWVSDKAGWITVASSEQRMVWLPRHLATHLQKARLCKRVISQEPVTILDFEYAAVGPHWDKCYQP